MRRASWASTRSRSSSRGLSTAVLDRLLGDLVEDHPAHRHLGLELLLEVPGDRLALAVLVGGEEELGGVLEQPLELGHVRLLVAGDHVVGREVVVDVDAEPGPLLALDPPGRRRRPAAGRGCGRSRTRRRSRGPGSRRSSSPWPATRRSRACDRSRLRSYPSMPRGCSSPCPADRRPVGPTGRCVVNANASRQVPPTIGSVTDRDDRARADLPPATVAGPARPSPTSRRPPRRCARCSSRRRWSATPGCRQLTGAEVLPQARGPAADPLLQGPRRLHLHRPARRAPSGPPASSAPAPATTPRAWRSPAPAPASGRGSTCPARRRARSGTGSRRSAADVEVLVEGDTYDDSAALAAADAARDRGDAGAGLRPPLHVAGQGTVRRRGRRAARPRARRRRAARSAAAG